MLPTPSEANPRESYLNGRWKEQCHYFEQKAETCQKRFMRLRRWSLLMGISTPILIFVVTIVVTALDAQAVGKPNPYYQLFTLLPIAASAIALGCYQWEELHNYGAQWSKFRMVVERLKAGVARLVGIEGGVVSGVFNLESSDVGASDRRPRHDDHYHEA